METPNLRRLLAEKAFVAAPGAMDALTARVIEAQGFSAIYLGGNAMGLHLGVGQPFVTLSETADCVRQVTAAISVPLIVDAGAGFGSAAHAHRTARMLERAGAAAIHFDDQPYPKRARYHVGDGGLAPVEETAAKIAAAVAARRSADFLIFARTDALRVTESLDQTIARCHAYAEAGADGLMILDLSPEQLAAIRSRLPPIPVAWFVSPAMPAPRLSHMEEAGFGLALYPFNTVAAIVDAVSGLWRSLRETGEIAQSPERLAALRRAVQDLIGMDVYWSLEAGAATSKKPEAKP
ncbi:MAG: isocitrate lyase/PEP mutase family protein [Rhodospirillaceae bacterium]|nr:isocitrate lyase/PEP mutase family protein [Rhodospirillaceae bacterium]